MGTTKFMNCDDEDGSNVEDCKLHQPKSVQFFSGQLLNVADFNQEKNYFNEKRHLLNRVIHGSGIVCGLEVKNVELTTESCICGPEGNTETISRWIADLSAGVALDCLGREIIVSKSDRYVISEKDPHQLSNYFGLFIKRRDHHTNPVPSVHVTSCEDTCCYSRILEDFQLVFDNLDQSVQLFFDSTTYGKKDQVVVNLIEPFEEQVPTRTVSLTIPSASGETKSDEILTLVKTLAGMNIFSSTLELLELLEGSKITVEYKTKDEEGEEKTHTSSAYISGSSSGKTSEVIEKKRLCEDYYKVWLKECMCCEDPTDAKVLLSVLSFSETAGEEKEIKILDEETTLFRSLVPNLKKLLDLITRKQPTGESDEKIQVNSGIVEVTVKGQSFHLERVDHKLNLPDGSHPPFVIVGILHEDHEEGDAMIKYMDEMIVPDLCARKFDIPSIFSMDATQEDKEVLRNLSDNQQSENFFLMVKAFHITRSDFILGAFNFREGGSKTFKAIWYASSNNFVPPVIEEVDVPDVFGLNAIVAETTLEGKGLHAEFHPSRQGTVTFQEPQADTVVEKGTTVTLTMVEKVIVPKVIGKNGVEARSKIEGMGLHPLFQGDDDVDSLVKFQEPPHGAEALPGDTVKLRTLKNATVVPFVKGMAHPLAKEKILAKFLKTVGVVLGSPPKVVITQIPEFDEVVTKDTFVNLTFGDPELSPNRDSLTNTNDYQERTSLEKKSPSSRSSSSRQAAKRTREKTR